MEEKSWKTNSQILFTWIGYAWRKITGQVQLAGFGFKGIGKLFVYRQLGEQLFWRGIPEDCGPLLSMCHICFFFSYQQNFRAVCSQLTWLGPQIRVCQQDAKNLTFNVFSFHLLLKSSENLIHYNAIHVVLLFLILLRVIIIPHKWELTDLTSPTVFFHKSASLSWHTCLTLSWTYTF